MWLFWSSFFLLGYAGISVYTGIKVLALFRFFFPLKAYLFWPLYILICYSFILATFFRYDWLRLFRQVAMISFPALVYFFMTLLLLDGMGVFLRFSGRIPQFSPALSVAGTGIALFLVIFTMVYGIFHARNVRTVHYQVGIDKEAAALAENGLRIALLSDLHIGQSVGRKWVLSIVDAINKSGPDIILFAGDIFDGGLNEIKDPEGVKEELRRLKAPLGVYASLGNHDVDRLAFNVMASTGGIAAFLQEAGIVTLQDELELVADGFYLVGRRDTSPIGGSRTETGEPRPDRKSAAELTSGLDKSRPIIFLDHQPIDFPAMEAAGADLILSGHSHKGQFFPGNVITARLFKKAGAVHYGHWQGQSAQGVVTSGAAVWGPPVRIGTNSEVVVIDILFRAGN
ncbi:MAG: metallophosphoesterase [Treponema sp.]|nr:metallophosphoesterase [Treponema sp.]